MKKQIILSALTISILVARSFAGNIELPNQAKSEQAPLSACYVKLKDGSYKTFQTLTLEKGLFVSPHLLADGKERISARDILEYRSGDILAIAPSQLKSNRHSNVSVNALPGFAVKVITGPISVYTRKLYNGTVTTEEYFIQVGDAPIQTYSAQLMREMLNHNVLALQAFERDSDMNNLYVRIKNINQVLETTAWSACK